MDTSNRTKESTRQRILGLLLREPATATRLAGEVGISPNGLRQHLAGLERDGLVERAGVQPTGGKPATLYRISAAGEALFPKGYAGVLAALTDEVYGELGDADASALLLSTGRRLGSAVPVPDGASAGERVELALAALAGLGAIADVERRTDGSVLVRGHSCPLSEIVIHRPQLCELLAEMLAGVGGVSVQETCDRSGERPRCAFVIGAA